MMDSRPPYTYEIRIFVLLLNCGYYLIFNSQFLTTDLLLVDNSGFDLGWCASNQLTNKVLWFSMSY
jgi:hypothetical protein